MARGALCAAATLMAALGLIACDAGDDTAPTAAQASALTMQATLAAGDEATWCQYILPGAGTPEGVRIDRIAHTSVVGATHHVIWYQMAETPASVADRMAPFRCDDGIHLRKTGILYAPPAATGALTWPAGVAAHLGPDAVTLVEWHVINFQRHPVQAEIVIDMRQPTGAAALRAGTLLFYDWFVHLPAGTTHTSRSRCRIAADVTLTWASQHMHQRGVGFSAQLLAADGSPIQDLLETDRWDAEAVHFPVGIPLRAGQWVAFACHYDNPSDYPVIEGDQADDEMCMFVGGYYPQIERPLGETCQLGSGSGPVFGGTASCADSVACLQRATSRVQSHACWNGTRAEDGDALVELGWRCASARCNEHCERTGWSAECLACLDQACAPEMARCGVTAG